MGLGGGWIGLFLLLIGLFRLGLLGLILLLIRLFRLSLVCLR